MAAQAGWRFGGTRLDIFWLAGAAVFAMAGTAQAQSRSAVQVEEVVVTAQKREQSLETRS